MENQNEINRLFRKLTGYNMDEPKTNKQGERLYGKDLTFEDAILRIADGNKDANECVTKILEDKSNILFVLTCLDSKHIYGSQLAGIYIANGKDIAKTMAAIKKM